MAQRTVVVTGASAGVGRAVARAFGADGARVALLARGREGLEAARREVESAGGEAMVVPTDVAEAEAVEAAAERVEREWGPIDVWVNDAMTTIFAPSWEIEPAEFERATRVTYLGAVWGTLAALRRMKPRDRGTIVQVGSALAYRAIPLQSPYCGAKHALRGFTDSVRCELLHEKSAVRVTAVHLPGLNTPQFTWCKAKLPHHPQPVPPFYQPEIAAAAVLWASKHRRRELFVGLPTLKAVWPNKLAPGLMDRYLAATAWDGQQTGDPIDPDRPSNLFEPVPRAAATHGVFDERARSRSPHLWLTTNRAFVLPLLFLAVAGLVVWLVA